MLLDSVLALGVGLVIAGVALIYWPAALIVAGLTALAVAFALDRSAG